SQNAIIYANFQRNADAVTDIFLKAGVTFESDGLIFELFNQRIRVPDALIPFDLTIRHQNIDDEQFYFYLELSNAIFGELIYQKVLYREMSEL
ncbi:MAG: DUF4166 domain-containing protein, partial [Pseudomonadota bacterium]